MGFPGPAYPRGYKNMGIDSRERFEVRDAVGTDPVSSTRPVEQLRTARSKLLDSRLEDGS
jgi:hypothetical protein